jgi:hypothetical protein
LNGYDIIKKEVQIMDKYKKIRKWLLIAIGLNAVIVILGFLEILTPKELHTFLILGIAIVLWLARVEYKILEWEEWH